MQTFLLWELPPNAQEIARQIFFWSGFSIWVGLAARFLVPTKVANGAWLTLCAGFIGSSLGPIATSACFKVDKFNPVGPAGFVAATLVASATLALFCVVSFFATPNGSDDEENLENEKRNDNFNRERRECRERFPDELESYRTERDRIRERYPEEREPRRRRFGR